MQLFLCPEIQITGTQLLIKQNPELVLQLRKVLRAQPGYVFFVQNPEGKQRWKLALLSRTDQEVRAEILETPQNPPQQRQKVGMLIALPNKQEKLELIIQKLTEIGVDEIFLRASERSVLKSLNPNKLQRLQKIMQEATEQAWNWSIPQFHCLNSLEKLHQDWNFIIFDLPREAQDSEHQKKTEFPLLGVIGPEGGLTEKDYTAFPKEFQICSLGTSVLRMETAAIIGAWKLRNS